METEVCTMLFNKIDEATREDVNKFLLEHWLE